MQKIRQYDVGVVFALPVRDQDDQIVDLDGSETGTLYLESPSGRRKTRAATIDPATDSLVYISQALDFDEWAPASRPWRIQGRVQSISPAFDISTTVLLLEVEPVLRAPILVIDAIPAKCQVFVPEPTLSLS